MQDLSLHLLDLCQNGVAAGAAQIKITLHHQLESGKLTITIADDGKGMDEETAKRVSDPFYTTRTTRKVGLGIPLFTMAARLTGGDLAIASTVGVGTTVTACFYMNHIDAMPLGDVGETYCSLVQTNPDMDFLFTYTLEAPGQAPRTFTADTHAFREILEGIPLSAPPVALFLREYMAEQLAQLKQPTADGCNQ